MRKPRLLPLRSALLAVLTGCSGFSRTYTESGQPVAPQLDSLFGPMESVFDVVAQAIDSEADSLTVRYDSRRGYPVTVVIDYIERAADDELTVKVTEYRTLSE